ncbi:hypothetical protein HYX11_02715 [Candidatus Woesearchaeota archaeon]|nr:hypothetical protein [Candidatus Woesearchaeota archaeon]
MKFKAKKSYGNYKIVKCPFCLRNATHNNAQGLEVCHIHSKNILEEFKCTCGSWLEVRSGKFGPYFNCMKCGNINYNKGMEIKSITTLKEIVNVVKKEVVVKMEVKKEKKEIFVDSNDSRYFD